MGDWNVDEGTGFGNFFRMIAGASVKTKATTRVQLELPQKSMERLTQLKDLTEATSYAEVVKNALRFYEFVVFETENGGEILVKQKGGDVVSCRVF